jgi:hypothetical protein
MLPNLKFNRTCNSVRDRASFHSGPAAAGCLHSLTCVNFPYESYTHGHQPRT